MSRVTIPAHILRTLLFVAFERCPARLLTDDECDQLDYAATVAQVALDTIDTNVIGRVAS